MITATRAVFPLNVIETMVPYLQALDTGLTVLRRPLRPVDPNQCVGVFPETVAADENSFETRGIGESGKPSLFVYSYAIHALVKHSDEIQGLADGAELTERVRDMLYDNQTLRVQLGQIVVSRGSGKTKRLRRFTVQSTTYRSSELSGTWYYLSATTFNAEVETN